MIRPHLDPWPAIALTMKPYQAWLTERSSLTARIMRHCTHFRVQVLHEHAHAPTYDEAHLLGMSQHQPIWVREVLLLADNQPVVFAHSILEMQTLRSTWQWVARLKDRPLGALLFQNSHIKRGKLHYRSLGSTHPLHQRCQEALKHPLPLCLKARRSLFYSQNAPLLVTEVFLPAILKLTATPNIAIASD